MVGSTVRPNTKLHSFELVPSNSSPHNRLPNAHHNVILVPSNSSPHNRLPNAHHDVILVPSNSSPHNRLPNAHHNVIFPSHSESSKLSLCCNKKKFSASSCLRLVNHVTGPAHCSLLVPTILTRLCELYKSHSSSLSLSILATYPARPNALMKLRVLFKSQFLVM